MEKKCIPVRELGEITLIIKPIRTEIENSNDPCVDLKSHVKNDAHERLRMEIKYQYVLPNLVPGMIHGTKYPSRVLHPFL